MTSDKGLTHTSLSFYQNHPAAKAPEPLYLSLLGLKQELPIDPQHDSLQFLKRNRHDSRMGIASSTAYSDLTTEIWDLEEWKVLQQYPSPGTQVSCMDWLSSDAFLTGGHDNSLSLWSEGVRVGQ